MLYNENLHEEEQHLIQQIAEQTERGKIDWELTEYNPLSFLNEDKIDKNPAVICQSFSFEAIIGGSRYELDVMENIDVPSGMGVEPIFSGFTIAFISYMLSIVLSSLPCCLQKSSILSRIFFAYSSIAEPKTCW